MEVLGFKITLEHVAIAIVGYLLVTSLFCGCCREDMTTLGSAGLDYVMGKGVHGSWDTREQKKGSGVEWRKQPHETYTSKMVTPAQNLAFFADTEFKPECCGSNYSGNGGLLSDGGATSGGCACMSPEQISYINTRGGNRSCGGDF